MPVDSIAKLQIEFCGVLTHVHHEPFAVGRDADLAIDDNPYLHRRFIEFSTRQGLWWIHNVGGQISATISDSNGRLQAWLAPDAYMPVVFDETTIRFTAGSTTYEFQLLLSESMFSAPKEIVLHDGTTTIGQVILTPEQRLLVIALAEPLLRLNHLSHSVLPTSSETAERLGWALTKFNRKLDNVCQKLAKSGVRGLHGGPGQLAASRRARLVEYALAVRLVVPDDLRLLDAAVAAQP